MKRVVSLGNPDLLFSDPHHSSSGRRSVVDNGNQEDNRVMLKSRTHL